MDGQDPPAVQNAPPPPQRVELLPGVQALIYDAATSVPIDRQSMALELDKLPAAHKHKPDGIPVFQPINMLMEGSGEVTRAPS